MGRRMAGRFAVLPFEVIDLLLDIGPYATHFYVSLLRTRRIEEDWEAAGAWVTGTFAATKIEMLATSGVSRGMFWGRGLWSRILESGLMEENGDATYTFTMLRKKIDVGIAPSEIKEYGERIDKLEQVVFSGEPESGDLELSLPGMVSEASSEPHEASSEPHEASSEPHEASSEPVRARVSLSGPLEEREVVKEKEGGSSLSAMCQNSELEPGTEKWVQKQVVNLWPTRGYQPHRDDEFVSQVVKFPVASQQEAFAAARDEPIQPGAWGWIINRLEHPDKYRDKPRGSELADRVAEILDLED